MHSTQGNFDVQHVRRRARDVFEHMQRHGGGHNYIDRSSRVRRRYDVLQSDHNKKVRGVDKEVSMSTME